MIPDIIDDDEVKTGIRREGVYFSVFLFIEKLSAAVAIGIYLLFI
jgi:glycoside/pentoside/hexuronide:cation symporter, GPH family